MYFSLFLSLFILSQDLQMEMDGRDRRARHEAEGKKKKKRARLRGDLGSVGIEPTSICTLNKLHTISEEALL